VKRNEVLVLAGGSQGEARSAMRRIAAGSHPDIKLEAGDTVVHSARVIPGNDRPAFDMFCDLLRQGALLHNRYSDPQVHTSGHAGRSEQAKMIEWIQPRHFVPLHGTLHHLKKHARLAESLGVKSSLVVENGTPVRLSTGGDFRSEAAVPHGRVHVAYGGNILDGPTLSLRAQLGRAGSATIAIAIAQDGRRAGPPLVNTQGVPNVDGNASALRSIAIAVEKALSKVSASDAEAAARHVARRVLRDLSGSKPNLIVQILEVD
jgi:ribonuclease J